MRRNGPKIKELAQELGVTARQLIDRCRSEGIFAQNSLTHIEPTLVPKIKVWFASETEAGCLPPGHQGTKEEQGE